MTLPQSDPAMNQPVELSITRLANTDTHPIRIAVALPGQPERRIVIVVGLEEFALTLTGRGAVTAVLEKNRIPLCTHCGNSHESKDCTLIS